MYWRAAVPSLPTRCYVPFYGRAEAEQFVGMASLLGPGHGPPGARRRHSQIAATLFEAAR